MKAGCNLQVNNITAALQPSERRKKRKKPNIGMWKLPTLPTFFPFSNHVSRVFISRLLPVNDYLIHGIVVGLPEYCSFSDCAAVFLKCNP